MEKIIKRLEERFDREMENFNKSPFKTSLKWIIIIYVIRIVWKWIKEDDNKGDIL